MGSPLQKLSIAGFKSIETLENFALGTQDDFSKPDLTVLIGANGAGKSNFVDFFRMLRAISEEGLQQFIEKNGGADGYFHLGPQYTRAIKIRLEFGKNVYEFDIEPAANGRLFLADERVQYTSGLHCGGLNSIGKGNPESKLKSLKSEEGKFGASHGVPFYVYEAICSWVVYHFHETSYLAPMRREQSVFDHEQLRPDAGNIAAYLMRLRETDSGRYEMIRDVIRLIAPFFDDFLFRPEIKGGNESVRLQWRQKGSDFPFQPNQFSDGTMRFICLATALQQPVPPSTIVIDEPELGLHPYALSVLADLIEAAAHRTQLVVATQSPALLDHFPPESVVVVSRQEGRTRFERPSVEALREWLEEYSMGELWRKNVIQGGPVHE